MRGVPGGRRVVADVAAPGRPPGCAAWRPATAWCRRSTMREGPVEVRRGAIHVAPRSRPGRTPTAARPARSVGRTVVGQARQHRGPPVGRSSPRRTWRTTRAAPRRGRLAAAAAGRRPARGRRPAPGTRGDQSAATTRRRRRLASSGVGSQSTSSRSARVGDRRRCGGGCRSPPTAPPASPSRRHRAGRVVLGERAAQHVGEVGLLRPAGGRRRRSGRGPNTSSPQRVAQVRPPSAVWAARAASRSPASASCSAPNSRTVSSIR